MITSYEIESVAELKVTAHRQSGNCKEQIYEAHVIRDLSQTSKYYFPLSLCSTTCSHAHL